MPLNFSWGSFSNRGPRPENEDAVAVWSLSDDWLGAAVADGLGGHVGGRQASNIALEILGAAIHQAIELDLADVALSIHERIRQEQSEMPALRNMATTLSAVLLRGRKADIVHCGDSRISLCRGKGIRRITVDHTEAQRFLDLGMITQDEYRKYPRRNILDSALGAHTSPRIDCMEIDIRAGDKLFLTTDGTHEKVALQELKLLSDGDIGPHELCRTVQSLVETRGPADNFSLVAIFVE